jgi:hypothetical protein
MLAAEFRYLGFVVAVVGVVGLSTFASLEISHTQHLPFWAFATIWFAMQAGSVAIWLWLRRLAERRLKPLEPAMHGPETQQPQARYAPIVVSISCLAANAYVILSCIRYMNATHQIGLDAFVASTLATIFYVYLGLRSRFPKTNTTIDPAA